MSMEDIIPGMTAFLPKPYTKDRLIGAVRALWFGQGSKPEGEI